MRRRFHHGPSARQYLTRRQKWCIYGVLGTLWSSGVLWLLVHYWLPQHGPFGDVPNPAEHWFLVVHGAGAFATLWLGGWMWHAHIMPWRRSGMRRRSGETLLWVGGVLIATGYLLYYAADETTRHWVSLAHWLVGLSLAAALLAHALRSRRYRAS